MQPKLRLPALAGALAALAATLIASPAAALRTLPSSAQVAPPPLAESVGVGELFAEIEAAESRAAAAPAPAPAAETAELDQVLVLGLVAHPEGLCPEDPLAGEIVALAVCQPLRATPADGPTQAETRVWAQDYPEAEQRQAQQLFSCDLVVGSGGARWYDPRNAVFLSEDPMIDVDSTNLYAFVGWSPAMGTDPTGEYVESAWDALSLGIGAVSLWHNVREGNWVEAGFDAIGVVADAAALALPLVPGGVGAALNAKRAVDALQTVDQLLNVAQGVGQGLHEAEEGNWGWAAFYGGMSALGAQGLRGKVGGLLDDGSDLSRKLDIPRLRNGALDAASGGGARRLGNEVDDVAARMPSRRTSNALEPPCPIAFRCFGAETLVNTDDGLVPITGIEVGDLVYAWDDATGEEHLANVLALHHREVEELWIVDVGGQRLETTSEHPFYVVEKGWTETESLQAGDVLLTAGGERQVVVAVERIEQLATVYNFEVAGLHSYFVGELGLVVHNCRASWEPNPGKGKYRGGPHNYTKGPTGDLLESHHMPTKAVSPLGIGEGPAIQMDPWDHVFTSSQGRSGLAGVRYRAGIKGLLDQGKWRLAMAREIGDVRRAALRGSGTRSKYNQAIREMLNYAKHPSIDLLQK